LGPVRESGVPAEVQLTGGVEHDPVADDDGVDVGGAGEGGEHAAGISTGMENSATGPWCPGASASITATNSGGPVRDGRDGGVGAGYGVAEAFER